MNYTYTYNNINYPNIDQITMDIENSIIEKAYIGCIYTSLTSILSINFLEELSTEEQTELQTIVNNNNNNNNRIVFKLTGTYICPINHNINLFGLFREDIFDNFGSLIEKNYYRNYDNGIYSDLVIKDEYNYEIEPISDLSQYRTETITWYLLDDSVGETKTFIKYYDLNQGIKEGITRRENLMDIAKAYGLTNIEGTQSSGLKNSHYLFMLLSQEIELYRTGIDKTVLPLQIANSTEEFLTQEIKNGLIDILDYWS